MLEKKVYNEWAFQENEKEKCEINRKIYEELKSKYKIIDDTQKYNKKTYKMEDINFDDYDLIYTRTACYGRGEYHIKKNNTKLTNDELALIFDNGNLCFGYSKEGAFTFNVYED
jgi:hypothetical protein